MEKASRIMMMDAGFRAQRADNDATQAELWETIALYQQKVAELEASKQRLAEEAAKAKGALCVEQAKNAGLLAQAQALKAEIPAKSVLLAPAGGVYPDGSVRTNLNKIFEVGFDAKIAPFRLPGKPADYRKAVK